MPQLIPTRASDAQHERYVTNITTAWRAASPADHAEGSAWYPVAHDLAEVIGHGDARMGAGIIAALSANCPWPRTVKLAHGVAASGKCAGGHLPGVLEKVRAILDGSDPADILPAHAKTGHFYRCILNPDDPDPVTIDRHAHDVAVGERYGQADRGLSKATRYATLAHAYREAARRLDVLPCHLQAVVWCWWRRTQL